MAKGRTAAQAGERILYEIVSTVGSSLELGEVLDAVVRLLSDASAVHACFVYLIEDDRLVLRAASEPYSELAGEIVLDKGEGIAWWAVEHGEPADLVLGHQPGCLQPRHERGGVALMPINGRILLANPQVPKLVCPTCLL